LALSIDALTVGLTLAAYRIDLIWFLILTASINSLLLLSGELIGKFLGKFISENKLKLTASITIIVLGLTKAHLGCFRSVVCPWSARFDIGIVLLIASILTSRSRNVNVSSSAICATLINL